MAKVKLIIERNVSPYGRIEKIVDVEKRQTSTKTRRLAELKYCNEYINRDVRIGNFTNLTEAKRFASLKIKSTLIFS